MMSKKRILKILSRGVREPEAGTRTALSRLGGSRHARSRRTRTAAEFSIKAVQRKHLSVSLIIENQPSPT